MAELNPRRIVHALADHGVDFVVIGASAALLQGVPVTKTLDFDITAAVTDRNRQRLAAALVELGARLRLPGDEGLEAPLDAKMLRSVSVVTLLTDAGPFDVLFAPPGAPVYEELKARSVEVREYGLVVRVAAIEDLIAMKRAAGREKDAAHLTVLLDHRRRMGNG
ncbi:MAG: nucleotidyltransferase [Actinobacteria bacterium]|nr:nucleotidyltransferase [Actinomycetota bacterium]